mgnify:CR=1 FL=1
MIFIITIHNTDTTYYVVPFNVCMQVLVITRREDDVMHALNLTLDWPKDMLPIKLLTPNTSDRQGFFSHK